MRKSILNVRKEFKRGGGQGQKMWQVFLGPVTKHVWQRQTKGKTTASGIKSTKYHKSLQEDVLASRGEWRPLLSSSTVAVLKVPIVLFPGLYFFHFLSNSDFKTSFIQ